MNWIDSWRFQLAVWMLRPFFPLVDVYAPDPETVEAITFTTSEKFMEYVQEYEEAKEFIKHVEEYKDSIR